MTHSQRSPTLMGGGFRKKNSGWGEREAIRPGRGRKVRDIEREETGSKGGLGKHYIQ